MKVSEHPVLIQLELVDRDIGITSLRVRDTVNSDEQDSVLSTRVLRPHVRPEVFPEGFCRVHSYGP